MGGLVHYFPIREFSPQDVRMMLELDPTLPLSESTAKEAKATDATPSAHGTVEDCEFEVLLERAMEIIRTRRVSAGSISS
jgi:hypothetical protein